MSGSLSTTLLGTALALGLALGARAFAWPLVQVELPAPAPGREAVVPSQGAAATDSSGRLLVRKDPFRLDRRPAWVAYDPLRFGHTSVAAAPKPVLALVGVVAGHDPTAVIEGFPGAEGSRVVRTGDVVAGLRVERISAQGVRIVGMDTTWVLGVREPWR